MGRHTFQISSPPPPQDELAKKLPGAEFEEVFDATGKSIIPGMLECKLYSPEHYPNHMVSIR